MSASETGTEHPDARTSPDNAEPADPDSVNAELDRAAEDAHKDGASDDGLIGVDEARERSGGDTADDANTTTEHDRAEGYS